MNLKLSILWSTTSNPSHRILILKTRDDDDDDFCDSYAIMVLMMMIIFIIFWLWLRLRLWLWWLGLGSNGRLLWSGVAGADRCTSPQPGRHNSYQDDHDGANFDEDGAEINDDTDHAIIIMKMVTRIKREATNPPTQRNGQQMRMIFSLKIIMVMINIMIIVLKMMILKYQEVMRTATASRQGMTTVRGLARLPCSSLHCVVWCHHDDGYMIP